MLDACSTGLTISSVKISTSSASLECFACRAEALMQTGDNMQEGLITLKLVIAFSGDPHPPASCLCAPIEFLELSKNCTQGLATYSACQAAAQPEQLETLQCIHSVWTVSILDCIQPEWTVPGLYPLCRVRPPVQLAACHHAMLPCWTNVWLHHFHHMYELITPDLAQPCLPHFECCLSSRTGYV